MEKMFYVVGIIAFAMIIIDVICDNVRKEKKRSFDRKSRIEIGQTINDRFDDVYRSLQRIEDQLGKVYNTARSTQGSVVNYRKEVKNHFNWDNSQYNKNLGVISQDITNIFELLNKQPEEKKDDNDNSAIWGIISGALSGLLSSALMSAGKKDSEKKDNSQNNQKTADECYAVQKIETGEILNQRFETMDAAVKWLFDNGLSLHEYNVGLIKKTEIEPEETQETENVQ